MNDTQPNERQTTILNHLLLNPTTSRAEIEGKIGESGGSRVTVIRDLNTLQDLGLIKQSGGGKHITYSLIPGKEILVPTNLDEYFLKSVDQRTPKYSKFNPQVINALSNLFTQEEIDIFEQGKKRLTDKFQSLDKTILKRELERFTIELSWKSSQIEGNTYSLLETEELIKNKKEAVGHDKAEANMILNHKSTFDIILAKKDSFKNISVADIRSIHSELTKNLEITSGIRESGVGITGTKYLPLDNKWQIEEALEKLVEKTKTANSIAEKALILLVGIAYLQPFADGNKRTSRMVSNAILLANGYYPLSYRSVDEIEYKKALILFYEQNNLYHLKRIFLEQQKFAIENYFI